MSQGRDVFSVRWGLEYPADPEVLGMIEEKLDSTLRRLRIGPYETERLMIAVLSVCEDVIVTLLEADSDRVFRVDLMVLGEQLRVTVRTDLGGLPDGAAVGSFKPHGATARLLELESLEIAEERVDDVEGEFSQDGELTLALSRTLPERFRRDPPMYG